MAAEADEEVPDHLRCRRTDGKKWRCRFRALDHVSFCELHQIQAQRRQYNLPVPESLKLRRRPRRKRHNPQPPNASPPPDHPPEVKVKEKKVEDEEEQEGRVRRSKRKRNEGCLVGLVRMAFQKKKRGRREAPAVGAEGKRTIATVPEENLKETPLAIAPVLVAKKDPKEGSLLMNPEANKDVTDGALETAAVVEKDLMEGASAIAPIPALEKDAEDAPLTISTVAEPVECSGDLPDYLRCRRTDGKQWRCRRRVMENLSYCEIHHMQIYRRQYKLGVPDSLKLRRGRRPSSTTAAATATAQPQAEGQRRGRKRKEVQACISGEKATKSQRRRGFLAGLLRKAMRRKRGNKKSVVTENPVAMGTTRNGTTVLSSASRTVCSDIVPEHLRCKRTDGKQWRCSRRALDNLSFCELHHIQAYRRHYKLGVPDSLKLHRKPRGPNMWPRQTNSLPENYTEEMIEDEMKKAKKMEKRRKENEALLVEVMGMVLERQIVRRKKEQKRRQEEAEMCPAMEVKKDLPNGLMTISPAPSGHPLNLGGHLDMKIGLDSSSFLRWCFRSKNADPSPISTLQMLPYARKAVGLGKRRKRICHHCRTSPTGRILCCSKCRKVFFCKICVKKWYPELSDSDIKSACPICRGNCCCTACKPGTPKEQLKALHGSKA